tara:strand:- start:5516 stop:5881 length:366 start_codon:yes stop_codon:yes gene_type:complete
MDSWGYHLILDCKGSAISEEIVKDANLIKEFTKILVDRIEMKAYGEPIIEHFATHEEKASGFSLVQLIETSAITGHFCDINGDFYLDIFSCKSFSVDIAKEIVYSYFKPKEIKTVFLERQA